MAVNEAVNNAMKHSRANELRLAIHLDHHILRIAIEDDGCGFDPEAVPADRNGLCNLRRRMASVGGACRIISSAGHGTRVVLELPLPEDGRRPGPHSPRSGGFP
jgi:signal transduction histidine kinase